MTSDIEINNKAEAEDIDYIYELLHRVSSSTSNNEIEIDTPRISSKYTCKIEYRRSSRLRNSEEDLYIGSFKKELTNIGIEFTSAGSEVVVEDSDKNLNIAKEHYIESPMKRAENDTFLHKNKIEAVKEFKDTVLELRAMGLGINNNNAVLTNLEI